MTPECPNLARPHLALAEPRAYRVVRFYRNGRRRRTIIAHCTLAVARLHCSDPRTRKAGVWFDGYEER